MNKRKVIISILFICLIVISLIGVLTWNYISYDLNCFFKGKNIVEVKSIIAKQNDKNKLFLEYANNSSYTLENPKIIIDPYNIGFKSALIIFNTSTETEISLYINDYFIKTFESSITHIIPISSIDFDKDNVIRIVTSEMESNSFIIKSEEITNNFVTNISLNNDSNLYVDNLNNIYEMNSLGKVYNVIYGVNDYSYQDNSLTINTINNEEWDILENSSNLENDDYTKGYNINFDTMSGKQYLFENNSLKKLPVKNYIKKLKNSKSDYKYRIENDILILDTKSDSTSVLLVTKNAIYKMEYDKFLKLNVKEETAIYVEDNGVYYDLEIVVK